MEMQKIPHKRTLSYSYLKQRCCFVSFPNKSVAINCEVLIRTLILEYNNYIIENLKYKENHGFLSSIYYVTFQV